MASLSPQKRPDKLALLDLHTGNVFQIFDFNDQDLESIKWPKPGLLDVEIGDYILSVQVTDPNPTLGLEGPSFEVVSVKNQYARRNRFNDQSPVRGTTSAEMQSIGQLTYRLTSQPSNRDR